MFVVLWNKPCLLYDFWSKKYTCKYLIFINNQTFVMMAL